VKDHTQTSDFKIRCSHYFTVHNKKGDSFHSLETNSTTDSLQSGDDNKEKFSKDVIDFKIQIFSVIFSC